MDAVITFGQQEYREDDKSRHGFEPWAKDAGYVFRWGSLGQRTHISAAHTEQQWIEQVEKEFAMEPEIRPCRWLEVLRCLDTQRRAGLAQAGFPDSAIADVLDGSA